MTLLEYIAALANKVKGINPQPGMTADERKEFDALKARVKSLEEATAPLVGEINGLPSLD